MTNPQDVEVHPIVRQIIDCDYHVGESYRRVIRHVISKLRGVLKTFSNMPKIGSPPVNAAMQRQHHVNR